jgi:hypothetical protein
MKLKSTLVGFLVIGLAAIIGLSSAGTAEAADRAKCATVSCTFSAPAYYPTARTISFGQATQPECQAIPCSEAVVLQWTTSSTLEQISRYEVYRNDVLIGTLPYDHNSFEDTVAGDQVTFRYMVRAVNSLGSADSNVLSYTTQTVPDFDPPSAPSNLTFQEVTVGDRWGLRLHWNASADNKSVARYEIIRMDNNNHTVAGYTVSGNQTSYDDLIFRLGTGADINYSYEVVAYDAAGNASTPSNEVHYPTRTTLSAQAVTVDNRWGARLSWNPMPDSGPVDHFVVRRYDSDSDSTKEFVVSGSQNSYDDLIFNINTGASTTFYYTVTAYREYDSFMYTSNTVAFSAGSNPPADDTDPEVNFKNVEDGSVLSDYAEVQTDVEGVSNIDRIELLVDGLTVYTSNEDSFYLDTYAFDDGEHELTVRVYDSQGNSVEKSTTITINNHPKIY